jgi:uncharacterized protein (TIRG00374 family)
MVKRTFVFIFFLIIGIGLFVSVIVTTGVESIAKSLSEFSLINFIFLVVLSLFNFALFTLRWDIIIAHHHAGKKIPFYRLFLHRMTAYSVNYLTPVAQSGGEPVRLFFLQDEGVDTKSAVSTIVIDKIFEYTALILFIFSGILISMVEGSIFSGKIEVMLIIVILLFGGLIFWFYYATMKKIGFFSSLLRFFRLYKIKKIKKHEASILHVEEQMTRFYLHNISKFIFLLILSFATVFFMVLEHWLIAYFMGVDFTFLQSFLSATIPGISYILPVPAGFGMLEGSHAGIFALLGISINVFVFVLIIRLRDLVFIFIGLAHASQQSISMIKKGFKRKN